MTEFEDLPRVAISVERTANLGNYESAKIFLSVNNLTAQSTPEDVASAIDFQGDVYADLKAALLSLVRECRQDHKKETNR